jgi:hypothetical protein
MGRTYITSEVLLPAQNGLISVEFTFELRNELLDALLVRRLPTAWLVNLFHKNAARDWLELRVFDARRLLELGAGLGLHGDQLWAGPLGREIAANGARLVQFEAIVLPVHAAEGGRDRTSHKTS